MHDYQNTERYEDMHWQHFPMTCMQIYKARKNMAHIVQQMTINLERRSKVQMAINKRQNL